MSEYQYYEFQALDKPLTKQQQKELRSLSRRAEITATSFVNEYNYGDFRGEPQKLMERYFDAFCYLANWGTRRLMFRLPKTVLDARTARRYCHSDAAAVTETADHVVIDLCLERDPDDEWLEGSGLLAGMVQARSDLAAGDLRLLYLAWLLGIQRADEEDDDLEDETEPPVPADLGELSGTGPPSRIASTRRRCLGPREETSEHGGKQVKRKKSIILPSVIPVRFPADEELAAAMRALPVMRLARALARWVGDEPIPIADGWQAPETKLDAARALGLVAEDGTLTAEITRRVNWICEIAFHAGYLHTDHGAVHRHHGLDTATEQTGAQIRTAWDGALNALFAHGVEDLLPEAANPAPLDFHGIGNFPLLAMLEQHGTATVAELSGEIALGATEGMTPLAAEYAWAAWTSKHGDPTRGYLGLAEELGVLRIDGESATLTPLGTWAMLRQIRNVHLEHLPDSAELTPYQVLVCRLGMSDGAFARELECWLTAREPGSAVTELLTEAAAQGDSPRYLRTGVQIAASISGDTHETWREALAMPEVRPYAAAELNRRAGRDFWDNPLPGLKPIHCDSAVMASHGIIAAYEGSKDPAEVAKAVREEASRTSEAAMFEEMWRSQHQVAYQALAVIGQHHPDKKTAKAARAALHKASSARLPTAPHGPLQPSARTTSAR